MSLENKTDKLYKYITRTGLAIMACGYLIMGINKATLPTNKAYTEAERIRKELSHTLNMDESERRQKTATLKGLTNTANYQDIVRKREERERISKYGLGALFLGATTLVAGCAYKRKEDEEPPIIFEDNHVKDPYMTR